MNQQQGFVVAMSGSRWPVEAARDQGFVVDRRELVMHLVSLRDACSTNNFLLNWF